MNNKRKENQLINILQGSSDFVSFLEVKMSFLCYLDYGTQIGSKVGMQKSKSTTVIICRFDSSVASKSQIEGLQIWEFLL